MIKPQNKIIAHATTAQQAKDAKRKLAAFREEQEQIDRSQGKLTLAELCDRLLKTVQYQKPKTVERKSFIVGVDLSSV